MTYVALLVVLLVFLAGVIAYAGDRLGTWVGRRRLTVLGARPKVTGQIVGVGAGILIMLTTLAVLAVAFENATQTLVYAQRTADELASLRAQERLLQVQIGDVRADLSALREDLDEARAVIEQAETERALALAERDAAAAERDQVRSERDELLEEIDETRAQLTLLAADLDVASSDLVTVEAALERAQSDRLTALAARDAALEDAARASAEAAELEAARDAASAERDAAEAARAQAQAEADALRETAEVLGRELETIASEVAELEITAAGLAAETFALQRENAALQQENVGLQARNEQLVSQNLELGERNESLAQLNTSLQDEILAGNEMVRALQAQVEGLTDRLEEESRRLSEVQQEFSRVASGEITFERDQLIYSGAIYANDPIAVREELAEFVRRASAHTTSQGAGEVVLSAEQFNSLVEVISETEGSDLVRLISPRNQFSPTQVEVVVEAIENTRVFEHGRLLVSRNVHLGTSDLPVTHDDLRASINQLKAEALRLVRRSGLDELQVPIYVGASDEGFTNQLLRLEGPVVIGVATVEPVDRAGPAHVELLIVY